MSDQLDVLKMVAERLDSLGIAYMVTGSLAASHYAMPRFTRDIDVVVEIDRTDAERLAKAFAHDFYADAEAIQSAAVNAGMVNLIHLRLLVKVDLIVRKDTAYRRQEFTRRRAASVEDMTIWIVSPEDLILSKLLWIRETDSEVQRRDVAALVSTAANLDREYIVSWADELGIMDLWQAVNRVDE